MQKENSFFDKSFGGGAGTISGWVANKLAMGAKEMEKHAGNSVDNLLNPIEAVDQPDNFSILKAGGMAYGATSFQTLTQNCFY